MTVELFGLIAILALGLGVVFVLDDAKKSGQGKSVSKEALVAVGCLMMISVVFHQLWPIFILGALLGLVGIVDWEAWRENNQRRK